MILGEMPTASLPDEILTPGEGRIRALLCIGGNPAIAWPNQAKTLQALDDLELQVAIDVELSASAKRADYVLPPTLSLERPDVTLLADGWYETPYVHYTQPVLEAPDGCIEEWEFYWELSHRLGTPIALPGGALDLEDKPSKQTVLEHVVPQPRVPWSEIRRVPGGRLFPDLDVRVDPMKEGHEARLDLLPDDVAAELSEVRDEPFSDGGGYGSARDAYTHRLISRRLRHVYNSSGQTLSALREKGTTNPAFMNPDDLHQMGIPAGAVVEIASPHATILGVATPADDVRPGVVSMAHAWGDPDADPKQVRELGSSTNALVDDATDYDPFIGMARQSAIPVNVTRAVETPPSG
jgi:anaerobic selenocysteine-containing dehydrogenase